LPPLPPPATRPSFLNSRILGPCSDCTAADGSFPQLLNKVAAAATAGRPVAARPPVDWSIGLMVGWLCATCAQRMISVAAWLGGGTAANLGLRIEWLHVRSDAAAPLLHLVNIPRLLVNIPCLLVNIPRLLVNIPRLLVNCIPGAQAGSHV
jgi:hypothetical protein